MLEIEEIFKIVQQSKEYDELEIYERNEGLDFEGTIDWIKDRIKRDLERGVSKEKIILDILDSLYMYNISRRD